MGHEQINLGSTPNDGNGDPLRTAFEKINNSFDVSLTKKPGLTDIGTVSETGVYHGVDVTGSPITGKIMVLIVVDSSGDAAMILVGSDHVSHSGNRVGGVITWHTQSDVEIYSLKGNNPTMKMEILAAGTAAQMQVIDLATGHNVAGMQYDKVTESFSFTLSDPATGTQKAFFQIKQDGKAYIAGHEIATADGLARPTVVSAYDNTPTLAQLKTAFEHVQWHNYEQDMDFYVRDDPQTKFLLVKYRTKPGATSIDPGNFWFEKLSLAS